ncbi:phage portal protein [Lysinibacillus sp. NPDC097214]|uniref:phage portal protein n=1 Tax=Lysinibacillus sp. NPDC097214 TaxID=3390584 RepID=UPI003D048CC5
MSFFKSLNTVHARSEPFLDHLVSLTSDDATIQYTSVRALRNSDIFAAVKILAGDIASSELMGNGKIVKLLNNMPNTYTDSWHFFFSIAANVLLNGNAFAEIERDSSGKVIAIHQLSNSVSVKQLDNGSIVYETTTDDGKQYKLDSEDILHFKHFTTDGLVGVSPLYALNGELKLQDSGNKLLSGFFNRGVNGGGILKVKKSDLDATAKEAIRKKFDEANGSTDNALKTIVLDETFEYTPIQINTEILKLVNSNDWTTKQIAKVYGLSTDRLGVEANHSNTEQSNKMYLQNTLTHYLKAFEGELYNKLGVEITFNVDRFNSDAQTTFENAVKAVETSIMTINEARKKIGLDPIENGDRLIEKNKVESGVSL